MLYLKLLMMRYRISSFVLLLAVLIACRKEKVSTPAATDPIDSSAITNTIDFTWHPTPVYADQSITFQSNVDIAKHKLSWDINGTINNSNLPTVKFPAAGSYIVTLTVDGNTQTQVSKTVDVRPPIPYYYYKGIRVVGHTINFFSEKTGGGKVDWDFGDGSTGTGDTTTHVYTKEGKYNIKIKVDGVVVNTPGNGKPLTIEIVNDPLYTNKITSTRSWQFTRHTILSSGLDTITQHSADISITMDDIITLYVADQSDLFEAGYYEYNKSLSSGNVLAYVNRWAIGGTIYYDHAVDTAYYYHYINDGHNTGWHKITTRGHTP